MFIFIREFLLVRVRYFFYGAFFDPENLIRTRSCFIVLMTMMIIVIIIITIARKRGAEIVDVVGEVLIFIASLNGRTRFVRDQLVFAIGRFRDQGFDVKTRSMFGLVFAIGRFRAQGFDVRTSTMFGLVSRFVVSITRP